MKNLLTILFIASMFYSYSQVKIGDNHDNINANSLLELESTDKGLLFPRVALTATDNVAPLAAHVQGMTVYNTATAGTGGTAVTPGLYTNNGTEWVAIAGSQGNDGKSMLNGTVVPTTEGVDGDFYYNTATNTIYGPKASGTWPSGTVLSSSDPVGEVITSVVNSTPTGYLYCNGQSVSTTTYSALFSAIGYTFGGSGGTFNVPDLRGQFLRGQDDGAGTDPDASVRTGGDAVGSTQSDATSTPNTSFTGSTNSTGNHQHNLPYSHPVNLGDTWTLAPGTVFPGYTGSGGTTTGDYPNMSSAGSHSHTVTVSSGGDSETRPMNIAVRYYIKF